MNRTLERWLGRGDDRITCSYDFAEIIPVWKTWWFWVIVGAVCTSTLTSSWMGWI